MSARNGEKERMIIILERLKKEYPESKISLNFRNPYELLVATVLSAQTTDAKVNEITPHFFERFPTPKELAESSVTEIAETIRQVNFHNNKAKFLKQIGETLVIEYGGKVPDTMKDLVKMKGVARKTANVVLWNAFGKNEGIAVDTHVKRIAPRLGLTRHSNPNKIERDLMEITPKSYWGMLTHLFIDHGRKICKPKRPRCADCVLNDLCPTANEFLSN